MVYCKNKIYFQGTYQGMSTPLVSKVCTVFHAMKLEPTYGDPNRTLKVRCGGGETNKNSLWHLCFMSKLLQLLTCCPHKTVASTYLSGMSCQSTEVGKHI